MLNTTLPPEDSLPPLTLYEALAIAAVFRVSISFESKVMVVSEPAPDMVRDAFLANDREFRDLLRPAIDKWQQSRQYALQAMPYADYLLTPEWRVIRECALADADFRCRVCNDANNLHVHHRAYGLRGAESPNDVIVLCAECHELFHENGRVR